MNTCHMDKGNQNTLRGAGATCPSEGDGSGEEAAAEDPVEGQGLDTGAEGWALLETGRKGS